MQADVFFQLWQAGVEQFDELQGIDWSFSSMDGVMTKAPLGGADVLPVSPGKRPFWDPGGSTAPSGLTV